MKICIPTQNDYGLESRVYDHFGSAPFFTMMDTDSGRLEVVRNTDLDHRHHSCHHIDGLKTHNVDVVVCNGVGRRAFAALQEAGIDVLVPEHATVAEIVGTVRAGKIRRLSADGACGGGGGHGRGNCHAHGPCKRHPKPAAICRVGDVTDPKYPVQICFGIFTDPIIRHYAAFLS